LYITLNQTASNGTFKWLQTRFSFESNGLLAFTTFRRRISLEIGPSTHAPLTKIAHHCMATTRNHTIFLFCLLVLSTAQYTQHSTKFCTRQVEKDSFRNSRFTSDTRSGNFFYLDCNPARNQSHLAQSHRLAAHESYVLPRCFIVLIRLTQVAC